MKTWISFNWLKLLAIAFLGGAYYLSLTSIAFPFAYYQYMNWVVVGASLVLAQQANFQNKMFFTWIAILIAVTFNPVAPMYFKAEIWPIVDLAALAIFFVALFLVKPKRG